MLTALQLRADLAGALDGRTHDVDGTVIRAHQRAAGCSIRAYGRRRAIRTVIPRTWDEQRAFSSLAVVTLAAILRRLRPSRLAATPGPSQHDVLRRPPGL